MENIVIGTGTGTLKWPAIGFELVVG